MLFVLLAFLAIEIPPLTGRVVDLAGLLAPEQRRELEERLAREEEQSSVQIVVATIPTLESEPLEDFSIRLAEAWRIGQKGLDNGAIVIVVEDERRVRVEIGYGLEPVIPDGMAGRIIRERMTPRFREGDFYGGIDGGIDGLTLAAREEYPSTAEATESKRESGSPRIIIGFLVAALGLLILYALLRIARRK
jgi:uncharacterized protein